MRSFRVPKASTPALLAFTVGPPIGTWTGHIFEDFLFLGCRSSTWRAYSGQRSRNPTTKRWVLIRGGHRALTKLVSLCEFTGAAHYSSGSGGRSSGGRRKDPSLLYGAGWEGGGEDVPVAVWWDFENCNVPQAIEVYRVGVNIVSGLRLSGFKGPVSISAYGDTLQLSRSTQEALASTGIRLHHVPSGGKDSSDRALLVDLILWTFDHPPPAHLFLISGDRDFSNALHRLRMRNYNILLACPHGTTVSPALLGAATHVWQWNSLVRGEGLLLASSPDGSSGGGSYLRHGSPRYYTPSYSPVQRSYDGTGPPSEGAMASTQMQSKGGEGNSVSLTRKPDAIPVLPLQPSQKQVSKDSARASITPEEGVAESSNAKPVLRQPPKKVLQQFKCLLESHPNGIMLTDLQNYIKEGRLNFEKDFYGHGKVVPFLSSIPETVRLERVLLKDNKSWSYNLFVSQGAQPVEGLGVQPTSSRQVAQGTAAAPMTSSQRVPHKAAECEDSKSKVKREELDIPGTIPSSVRSVDQGQDTILLTDDFSQTEEIASKNIQSKQTDELGKNHKDENVLADGLTSHVPTSASDSSLSTSKGGTVLPTFLGSFVGALRNWRWKNTVVEEPNLPQQVQSILEEKDIPTEDSYTHGRKPRSTEYASLDSQLNIPDTSPESVSGQIQVNRPSAKGNAEYRIEDGIGEVSRLDASEVIYAEKQPLSKCVHEGLEARASEDVSVRQVEKLTSESLPTGSTTGVVSPVMEKDRRSTWETWLFGSSSGEASSTPEVELKTSSELNQICQSEAVKKGLECKEAEVGSEFSKDSVTSSGESLSTQPSSLQTRTKDEADEFWGHSFVIRQGSQGGDTRSMKVWEEMEEYVTSAECTLLLSNASNLSEAVNLIKAKGPARFRSLDSNQISAVVSSLAEARGIRWKFREATASSRGSVAGAAGNLRLNAVGDAFESKDAAYFESLAEGREMRIRNGIGSSIQKRNETGENVRDKLGLERGDSSSEQETLQDQTRTSSTVSTSHLDTGDSPDVSSESIPASWQQCSEAVTSDSTPTTSVIETTTVHPSFEEFEEWFLKVVNSAFKRSARVEKVGYDLSLVKPDFEKDFGVRLDPKLYGFSRVQDLVASVPSVRLSRPRIDQCTIHLQNMDVEISEPTNQSMDEQVEEPSGSFNTRLLLWPKMYHDCKTLVRELMLENPEGVPGIKLKPLFGSRYNYPLDHKRVGYQRLSDLLRLMPDVVSVNGNLLVPSEEFLRTLKKEERAGKVTQNEDVDVDSEDIRDDRIFPDAGSGIGENWSEIDKEANGFPSPGYTNGEIAEVGRLSPNQHSSRREVSDDLCLSSEDEDESDSAEVDSESDHFHSLDEDILEKEGKRIALSHVGKENEMIGPTRRLPSSKDYEFSDEIDELLLEDNHIEMWLEENRPDIEDEQVTTAESGSGNVKTGGQLDIDGDLHEDWAAEILKEKSTNPSNDEHTIYSDVSGVSQDEETYETVGSGSGERTSATSLVRQESIDRNTSAFGVTSRKELESVTGIIDEQRQEEPNSRSLEPLGMLQEREELSGPMEESPQVDKSRLDSTDESLLNAIREPSGGTKASSSLPRDDDVFCYTPSAEVGSQVEDMEHGPNSSSIPEGKVESKDLSAVEKAEDISNTHGSSSDPREEKDGTGETSSEECAKKSVWRRLFK